MKELKFRKAYADGATIVSIMKKDGEFAIPYLFEILEHGPTSMRDYTKDKIFDLLAPAVGVAPQEKAIAALINIDTDNSMNAFFTYIEKNPYEHLAMWDGLSLLRNSKQGIKYLPQFIKLYEKHGIGNTYWSRFLFEMITKSNYSEESYLNLKMIYSGFSNIFLDNKIIGTVSFMNELIEYISANNPFDNNLYIEEDLNNKVIEFVNEGFIWIEKSPKLNNSKMEEQEFVDKCRLMKFLLEYASRHCLDIKKNKLLKICTQEYFGEYALKYLVSCYSINKNDVIILEKARIEILKLFKEHKIYHANILLGIDEAISKFE